ncbi:hypothetical protein N7478_006271 [Penicillium angulare]|uniref:uncharacterized protein n=1 Tax=Penicillium angulare TaxID=116970 RepID=UPI0025408C66|nr:uncharacterized protein N7478_006271 [Penicillium angulare]KAJ5280899.1 hypothetical protein N7478_006271 [Penicillium angulare]
MPPNRVRQLPRQPSSTPYRAPLNLPRRRGPQLDVYTRTKITTLRLEGLKYKEIHARLPHIPFGTIASTCYLENKRENNTTSPRSGRPRKISEDDRDRMFEAIYGNPRTKIEDLMDACDCQVYRQSIWRLLKEANMRKWRCMYRPELTDEWASKRLQWALTWQNLTPEEWKLRLYWSDESTVERGKGARQEWTFTRPKYQAETRDVQTFSYKGVKQMFWAAFSGCGRRTGLIPLYPPVNEEGEIVGGINRWVILELYQSVLPTLINGNENAVFMQDNAPVHTAYVVRDWLRDQDFEVMVWPPHSPDLNPIENLWALLKAKIYELHAELHTMPDNDDTLEYLVACAQEAWSEIDLSILENLAITMPHRVKEIIDNKGWYTSY